MVNPPGGYAPPHATDGRYLAPGAPGAYPPVPLPEDPRTTPSPPSPNPSDRGLLAVLLVAQAAIVLGFFVLSIVAVWIRAAEAEDTPSAPPTPAWTATPEPNVMPPSAAWVGVVYNTGGIPGVIREQPSTEAPKAGSVPPGTELDVLDKREAGPTWYRVRTRGRGPVISGWMHGNILRPKE